MTVRVEWMRARETRVQVFAPGDDWIGAGQHRLPVLTLAVDEVLAIEGTPAELHALAERITAAASTTTAQVPPL